MILAMAQHQLQQEQPARTALTEGLRVAQKLSKTLDGEGWWSDWIIAQVLVGQATTQFGPASIPNPP